MKTTKPVAVCPHCGGESGFRTNIILKAVRFTNWDTSEVNTEGYSLASETDPRCLDCGKPVRSLFRHGSQPMEEDK